MKAPLHLVNMSKNCDSDTKNSFSSANCVGLTLTKQMESVQEFSKIRCMHMHLVARVPSIKQTMDVEYVPWSASLFLGGGGSRRLSNVSMLHHWFFGDD